MQEYIIQITNRALRDMEEIYNYIAYQLQSPDIAKKQFNRIAEAIENLKVFPKRLKVLKLDKEQTMKLRQLIVDNYSVFYVIKEDKVIVVRVLYSSSDISKRL